MNAGQDTRYSCECGTFDGQITNLSGDSCVHAVCYCADCRATDVFLGKSDPQADGIDLIQVSPSDVSIDTGAGHLALLRLYPTGILRWYATCCDTHMFNTAATPKLRFVTVRTTRLDAPNRAGPVRARAFVPRANGKRQHLHATRLIWPVIVRSVAGLIDGSWRDTPLFDPNFGKPIREARVLTRSERRKLGLGAGKTTG